MEADNCEYELEEQLQQQQAALSEIQVALQLDASSEELQEVLLVLCMAQSCPHHTQPMLTKHAALRWALIDAAGAVSIYS